MPRAKSVTKAVKETVKKPKAGSSEFKLDMPDASSVYVAGEFNRWGEEEIKMKRDKAGTWKVKVKLLPGSYQYKFVVDGRWIEDPSNPATLDDPFGGRNSVIVIE